jgi:hypothetical protein
MRRSVLGYLLLGVLLALPALPAAAQLQYFGYVGNAEDTTALNKTHGFTNFAHVSSREYLGDLHVRDRITAMSQKGLKATVDLGLVLWCNYDQDGDGVGDGYRQLCYDFVTRWNTWKQNHASVLTPDKVIAFSILDEPFARNANMQEFEYAAGMVKAAFPWAKVWMVEAACVVEGYCGETYYPGLASYTGSLPNVDWLGLDIYGIRPKTDPTFLNARARLKARFPGRKWLYVMDSFWAPTLHGYTLGPISVMGSIARDWYDVARADADAVLLGGFLWGDITGEFPGSSGANTLPCAVLAEHVAIGRAVTGKARPQTSLPIGTFAIDSNGTASGWVCDPDGTVCEIPRADLYVDGALLATPALSALDTLPQAQCSTGYGYRFRHTMPRATADRSVTLRVQDLTAGTATVASTCAQSPACVWTPHLRHFGYVGGADDDFALNQTKGYSNYAHIAAGSDVASPVLRDRVTAMSQKGLQATIDLGRVFWCGTNFTFLCSDYAARWNTWKQTNATVLSPDKVLAFAVRDQPFFNRVQMTGYETAARLVKTDFPWAKIFLIEAACAVRGSCNGSSHTAFSQYTGTLPDVDWVGVAEYAVRPATDNGFKNAVQRLKLKFPGKKTVYVLDGYWDAAHDAALSSTAWRALPQEWLNVARNDFDSVLLGVFSWLPPGSGTTGSRNLACNIMSEHVAVGREITGKVRAQTGPPLGKLEGVYGGNLVGWACDPDGTVCENPPITVGYGGFSYAIFGATDRNDYALNPQCGAGLGLRFRHTLSIGSSGHPVTVKARDLDSATTVTLPSNCLENPACVWYSSYSQAKGYMEDLEANGLAHGWVCDPDAPHLSTQVKLVANNTVIGIYTANLGNEQAVADECGGGLNHRFQVQLPAWTRGWPVEAYAVDLTSGETLIPWLCSDPWTDNWSCTW